MRTQDTTARACACMFTGGEDLDKLTTQNSLQLGQLAGWQTPGIRIQAFKDKTTEGGGPATAHLLLGQLQGAA